MFNLFGFISTYLGQMNVGDTPENIGECVGLVEKWLDVNGKLHIWGNARELLVNADVRSYRVFKNNPTNVPPAGSIIVWDGTWGNGFGHTAVVIAGNMNHFVSFEQNNPVGHPPTVVEHDYQGVLGWITW